MKFDPNPIAGPLCQVFLRRALEIKAADLGRSHTVKGEAAFVIGVDKFVGRRRSLRQNSEPTEGIDLLIRGNHAVGNGRPANAVKAITARNKVARQLLWSSIVLKTNTRH